MASVLQVSVCWVCRGSDVLRVRTCEDVCVCVVVMFCVVRAAVGLSDAGTSECVIVASNSSIGDC